MNILKHGKEELILYSVSKIEVHKSDELFNYCDILCHQANNLYNVTNYFVRQIYTVLTGKNKHTKQLDILKEVEDNIIFMNQAKIENFNKSKKKTKNSIFLICHLKKVHM